MALIIATGFVVDDSIVMIEKRRALSGGRQEPARGCPRRRRTDRLHDSVADHFADRGADPPAFHGRGDWPPLQRVRRDARHHDRHFRRGLADRRADALRPGCCVRRRSGIRAGSSASAKASSTETLAAYERGLRWVLDHQTPHTARGGRHGGPHGRPVRRDSEGPVPGAGRRRDPGHQRGGQLSVVHRDVRCARRRSPTPSSRTPDVVSATSYVGIDGINTTLKQRPAS